MKFLIVSAFKNNFHSFLGRAAHWSKTTFKRKTKRKGKTTEITIASTFNLKEDWPKNFLIDVHS